MNTITAVERLRMLLLILEVGGRVNDAQLMEAEAAAQAEQSQLEAV
jgi:hypothetical protein